MITEVGKVIYSLLANDEELTKLVGKKIYPLVANSDTTFPFIIYRRASSDVLTSKDKFFISQIATIEIMIASDTYDSSINIAEKVIKSLVNKKGNIANIQVKRIELQSTEEDYVEETYLQKITFSIEII